MSDVTHPDKYRDARWDYENIQAQMLYEIAVQLERIADQMEQDDE